VAYGAIALLATFIFFFRKTSGAETRLLL